MKYDFKHPYTFEKKEYTFIDIPIENLTGRGFSDAKRSYLAMNRSANIATLAIDQDFAVFLASTVCKLPIEFFEEMPAPYYCGIAMAVTGFLLV